MIPSNEDVNLVNCWVILVNEDREDCFEIAIELLASPSCAYRATQNAISAARTDPCEDEEEVRV